MTNFTNSFGGSPISPAYVAYSSVNLTTNTQFYWPQFSAGQVNVIARFMNVNSVLGANLQMPDATLVGLGYDAIIFNGGSNSFNVVSFTGGAIATIQPGTAWYIQVTDNTTQSGAWLVTQFGAGTSSAQASQLAGQGLAAMAGVLNLNLNAIYISTNFNISSASLSQLYVWQGGSGTVTLPDAAATGDGFFFMLANAGSSSITVATTGANLIDGASSSTFSQLQSAFIVCTGTGWNTVGKGTQTSFAFTLLNLNVAGNTDVTLTSTQAQNVIQTYTGALTGNINVNVPASVQFYIVNNQTSGAFTLAVKTPSGTGIQVPQGQTSMLYCDGTNVLSAFSFVPSGSTFAGGSAASPGINWQGNTNTGFFQPTTNQVGISTNGLTAQIWLAQASAVNYFQSTASSTGLPLILQAIGTDGNINMQYLTKGTGTHIFRSSGGIQAEITNTASAVNWAALTGSATGAAVSIGAAGGDANINLNLVPQGTGAVAVTGTNGLQVPQGTTGQRVGTTNGTLRYNTTTSLFEAYIGGWTAILYGADNLLSLTNAATARTNLGVAPGAGLQQSGSTLLWDFTTEQSIASAATTDLGTKTSNVVTVTGTTGITSFGNSANTNNPLYFVRMQGAVALTNSGTLILPGATNYTTAAGDMLMCKFEGASTWRVTIFPASGGTPITSGVTSWSGDGTFSSNVSSTGAVTMAIKTAAGGTVWGNNTGSTGAPGYTAVPVLGINTSVAGTLGLANGGASGASITLKNLGCTVAYSFNLPITAGSANNFLTSQAGGSNSMTWTSASGVLDLIGSTRGSLLYRGASGWSILAPGTATNVLTSNGVGADPSYAAAATGLTKYSTQTFTSGGTWTPTAGTKFIKVRMCGGGGGGGGAASFTGAGGGAGGYLEASLTAAQFGASQTVTIGAAGTAGTAGGGTGGNGGTTSLGSLLSCTGGTGGPSASSAGTAGGTGGAATVTTGTSMLTVMGQTGGWGAAVSIFIGGGGGSSGGGLGLGGQPIYNSGGATVGNTGTGFGAGGGGAVNTTNTGGAGTGGIIIIEEYQ